MAVNFQRMFIAIAAFVIIGLVILVIMQNRVIEKFDMVYKKGINTEGIITTTLYNTNRTQCENKCKTSTACIAANIDEGKNLCLLKSTVNKEFTDPSVSSLRFPCELYNKEDFNGKGIGLDIGKYTLSDLQKKGYIEKSLVSIRLYDGYKITLYDKDAFGGMYVTFKSTQPDLSVVIKDDTVKPPQMWSSSVSSIILERI